MPQHPPAPLDRRLALAQGYANFAMCSFGHGPPALLADPTPGLTREAAWRGYVQLNLVLQSGHFVRWSFAANK